MRRSNGTLLLTAVLALTSAAQAQAQAQAQTSARADAGLSIESDEANRLSGEATALAAAGRLDEAAATEREALKLRLRFLGREHPDTLASLVALAAIHQRQGHPLEAGLLLRHVLTVRTRVLGAASPDTAAAARLVAGLPPPAGQSLTAAETQETTRLVASLDETFRETSARTQEEFLKAEPRARRLAEIRASVLGATHPETLAALLTLGRLYQYTGRQGEAEVIYRHVLAAQVKALGPGDPATIATLPHLLLSVNTQGSPDYAAEIRRIIRGALADGERALGTNDPRLIPLLDMAWNNARQYPNPDNAAVVQFGARSLTIKERLPEADRKDLLSTARSVGQAYADLGQFAEADRYSTRALTLAESLYDPLSRDVLWVVADVMTLYHKQHRYAEAERLARRLVDGWTGLEGASSPATKGYVSQLATIQKEAGHPVAVAQASTAPVSRDEQIDAAADQALTARNLYEAGKYDQAEPGARAALAKLTALLGAEDGSTIAATTILSQIVRRQGKLAEAEQLSRQVLDIQTRKEGPTSASTIVAMNDLANVYMAQDRYADAQQLYERAVLAVGNNDTSELRNLPLLMLNLAGLYRAQRRDEEAEKLMRNALQRSQLNRGRDDPTTINAVVNLAELLRDRGALPEARAFAERAVQSQTATHHLNEPMHFTATALLASIAEKEGRLDEAEALYRQTLAGRAKVLGGRQPDTLQSTFDLAEFLARQGRAVEAATLHRQAFDARLAVLGREHPDTLSSAAALTVATLTLRGRRPPDIAVARLVIEETRARRDHAGVSQWARAQEEREATVASARFALFGDAAWAGRGADPLPLRGEAFTALQDAVLGAADRSIAEAAARRYASGRFAGLGKLIAQRQKLLEDWAFLDASLSRQLGLGTPESVKLSIDIRKQLDSMQSLLGEIDALLRDAAPDYFSLARPTPLSIADTQALLGPDEAMLLAVPSRFGTHVVAVTREGVAWNRSDWTADRVRRVVQQLRWDASYELGGSPAEFADTMLYPRRAKPTYLRTLAFQLYQQLVAPVAATLAGKRQVYVAAGGSLAALPFSILVSSAPSGADDDPTALRGTRWFGEDVALVHIPSIQSLALLRRSARERTSATGFLGIGDPVLAPPAPEPSLQDTASADTPARGLRSTRALTEAGRLFTPGRTRDAALASPAALRALPSLPGTAIELERVREALGAPETSLLMREAAVEPRVRAADFSKVGVLLFSTHGATVDESGAIGEAGLVLTPPAGDAQPDNDGYLSASEVTTLPLNADWVILSACNTATGDGTDNPGLGQLARAFFYAGARNLLASHWPVADAVSPTLITRTLALARAGGPRAEAFRQAMHAIRMNAEHDRTGTWAHPFFWAPFVLIGDGGR